VCHWILIACAVPPALAGCGGRPSAEPLALGQLVPLSGPDRGAGQHAEQGAALAVKVAHEEGKKVLGRDVVVRHVDTRGVPEAAQAEAVRLLKVNRVAGLLGGPDAATAERTARAAQPYEVPLLVTADVPGLPVGDAAFSLSVLPAARGELLARFAAQDLRAGRVAVVTDASSELSQTLAAGFGREWRRLKSAAPEEWTYREEADRAALPDRGARAKPDLVVLATGPRDFGRLRADLVAAKVKAPLLYGGEDSGATPPGGPEGSGDVYLATVYAAAALSPKGQEFAKRYEQEYREPPDLAAAQAYDGVGLLLDALGRAGSTTPKSVRDELAATDNFEGVTGPLGFQDRGVRRNVFVVRFRGGAAEIVRTFGR
jgi:branched-chain amino acid transport system substrate-binding protein